MPQDRLFMENADICLTNFRGEEKRSRVTGKIVNAEGDRNFCVKLSPEQAADLKLQGWNVKPYFTQKNTERVKPDFEYLPVTVDFSKYPPLVYLISGSKKTKLDQNSIGELQGKEFENIDIIINPYHWEMNQNRGIKAYLYKAWFTLALDRFDEKYSYLKEDDDNPPFPVEEEEMLTF